MTGCRSERSVSGSSASDPHQSNLVCLARRKTSWRFALRHPDRTAVAARRWKRCSGLPPPPRSSACCRCQSSHPGRWNAPRWHFDLDERLHTVLTVPPDDPRWIAMLPAVLTVSDRGCRPAAPVVVDTAARVHPHPPGRPAPLFRPCPAGLAVGWFVALVVWVVGTPALEVPPRRRGADAGPRVPVSALTVVRPAGRALVLSAAAEPTDDDPGATAIIDLFRTEPSAATGPCGSSGASCDCGPAKPRRCSSRCAGRSNTAA